MPMACPFIRNSAGLEFATIVVLAFFYISLPCIIIILPRRIYSLTMAFPATREKGLSQVIPTQ